LQPLLQLQPQLLPQPQLRLEQLLEQQQRVSLCGREVSSAAADAAAAANAKRAALRAARDERDRVATMESRWRQLCRRDLSMTEIRRRIVEEGLGDA